ncbi:MAG: Rossmann-like and DUF2520 domain-containing protein [Pseudomonadota bacterium]
MKPSFAIVGCGKVGTALGVFLARAGYRAVGFTSRSLSSAKQAAKLVRSDRYSDVPWEVTRDADVVIITTPDGAIKETCDRLSQHNGIADNTIVLHCSGALPSTVLSVAKKRGVFTGSMHPLQSFAAIDVDVNPFAGIIISVEGERQAVETAGELAADLGGTCVTIDTASKTLYHASAVTASNYLVTLLDLALRLIREAGIPEQDAFKALKPLIEGTLSNIEKVGVIQALTGPIVRGDVETVEKHIEEIELRVPELLALYKTLGSCTVDIATKRGTISRTCAETLKKITSP